MADMFLDALSAPTIATPRKSDSLPAISAAFNRKLNAAAKAGEQQAIDAESRKRDAQAAQLRSWGVPPTQRKPDAPTPKPAPRGKNIFRNVLGVWMVQCANECQPGDTVPVTLRDGTVKPVKLGARCNPSMGFVYAVDRGGDKPAEPTPVETPKPVAPSPVDRMVASTMALASERPDFADDVDRIVQGMVAAGHIIWDSEVEAFRLPYKRHWKYDPNAIA